MNFLVDAQLPQGLAAWVRGKGHQAIHVADLDMSAAADDEIANYIARSDLIMVSKDADFAYLRLPDRFAFLWLQCGISGTVL